LNFSLNSFISPVKYPVDLSSQDYSELNSDSGEYLSCLHLGTKSIILPVVALYLHGKWWPIRDVLKTSSIHRNGLVFVSLLRIYKVILFLLSQIVFGVLERPLGEHLYFSIHPAREHGKLLWQDGEAVGFYTIKKKGSLGSGFTGQSYLLPVLDTVFVRTHWRRRGLALHMLQDFCMSMPTETVLGISYPISPSMYAVCKKYLETHQEQRERLYEVEAPGEWSQRRNVWLNVQLQSHPTQGELLCCFVKAKAKNVLESMSPTSTESRRPQRSCVQKRLVNQVVFNKCKKAKTSY
uniref:Family with sequence similarity 169 member B n=1 Tax=Electrophorus electricus TaxID=8005 RepID=A0A4W4HB24_ELEEL